MPLTEELRGARYWLFDGYGVLADKPADERASAVMLTQDSRKALGMCQQKGYFGISSNRSAWLFAMRPTCAPSRLQDPVGPVKRLITAGAQVALQDDFLMYGNAGLPPG